MEGAAVKKEKHGKPAKKGTKGDGKPKGKSKNKHHGHGDKKKTNAKKGGGGKHSKKKSGFGCCGKKKKGKHSKKTKKVTKQPKPINPPPNEELGDIVLVGKAGTPKKGAGEPTKIEEKNKIGAGDIDTPQDKIHQLPKLEDAAQLNKDTSDPNFQQQQPSGSGSLPHSKKKRTPPPKESEDAKKAQNLAAPDDGMVTAKETPPEKVEKKGGKGKEKKKEKEKETEEEMGEIGGGIRSKQEKDKKKKEKDNEKEENTFMDEEEDEMKKEKKKSKKEKGGNSKEKEKWVEIAKKVAEEDAQVPEKEFDLVAGFMPSFVSKKKFVANMSKNRFADVICMDHSRVQLSDDNYIHANFVEIDEKKSVILTQLPLPNTASDFWQMIIDQSVKGILLILTDDEYDELGGDFVFPKNQDFLHFEDRNIRVGEYKNVEIQKGWELKVLSITNGTYKSFFHLHHFKLWPHDGIPQNPKTIWQIQSALRKYNSPMVYMSLSGCGRAGTYALLENAHSSLHSEKANFELIKCLQNVRTGRLHSCQNITQYSFVYSLIAEHVIGNGYQKHLKVCNEENEDEAIQKMLKNLVIP
ncbi:unnamed protein product [Caenorhabditis angaria]|uniref:Tyrosine-protein phosphatase domain-containing protein n=1 Tax=Caenorhabditis angaria TaxID=860376 RepID=A0A9P1I338_9PELO|nr:unnamed protein product [Caenorhabditis angaria]